MMSYTINRETVTGFIFPALIASLLFLTAVYIQPFGIIFSIFSPLPIVIIFLQKGLRECINLILLVTFLIAVLGNTMSDIIYFIEYGLMAVVLGETISRRYSVEKVVLSCVAISFLSVVVVSLAVFMLRGINLYTFFIELVDKSFDNAMELISKEGHVNKGNLKEMYEYAESMKTLFVNSFPALLAAGSAMGAIINYVAVRFVWIRYNGNAYFKDSRLSHWSSPEYFIWIFIVAGFLIVTGIAPFMDGIALNVFIIIVLIYYFQGIAIISFLLSGSQLPVFFKAVSIILVLTQPLFVILTIGLGVFDLWIDFRRLKNKDKGAKR